MRHTSGGIRALLAVALCAGVLVSAAPSAAAPLDSSPGPTISASATKLDGTEYVSGSWTNQQVTVEFTCEHLPPGAGCPSPRVHDPQPRSRSTTEVTGTVADPTGTFEDVSASITVRLDTAAPAASPTARNGDGTAYTPGVWTGQNVTVDWNWTDVTGTDLNGGRAGHAGIDPSRCPESTTTSTEGSAVLVTATCHDNVGNESDVASFTASIDMTAPTITFSGNARTYAVDQHVDISCTAHDALSGIWAESCDDITGPAYDFMIGTNELRAAAYDLAGNAIRAATYFRVLVTFDGLANLTTRFSTNPGVAKGLLQKLDVAERHAAAGRSGPKANALDAYRAHLAAQAGKALTTSQAHTLASLSQHL